MRKFYVIITIIISIAFSGCSVVKPESSGSDLNFSSLAKVWDEAGETIFII